MSDKSLEKYIRAGFNRILQRQSTLQIRSLVSLAGFIEDDVQAFV